MSSIDRPTRSGERISVVYCGLRGAGRFTTLQALDVLGSRKDRRKPHPDLTTDVQREFQLLLEADSPVFAGLSRTLRSTVDLRTSHRSALETSPRSFALRGADALVWVVDSRLEKLDGNIEALELLSSDLGELGVDLAGLPVALQYNRRDAEIVAEIDELDCSLRSLWPFEWPRFESVATRRRGVIEPLREVVRGVLQRRA